MLTAFLLTGLEGPARYLSWGWLSISVPNLIVILVMLVLFGLALVLPFPKGRPSPEDHDILQGQATVARDDH